MNEKMLIEDDIHRIKMLKVIYGPSKGKLERFSAIFNVAAGIANMHKISMKNGRPCGKSTGNVRHHNGAI